MARELSYLGLLVGLGEIELEGAVTIPELIATMHRDDYFEALADADRRWAANSRPEVDQLESLLCSLLLDQIESAGRESGI